MQASFVPSADLYVLLGVDPTATGDQVKAAHRRLIRQLHPDHGGDAARAAAVNAARDVLLDPAERARYDAARNAWLAAERARTAAREAAERAKIAAREAAEQAKIAAREAAERAKTAAREAVKSRPAAQATAPMPAQATRPVWRPGVALGLAEAILDIVRPGSWQWAVGLISAATVIDTMVHQRIGDDPAQRAALDEMVAHLNKQKAQRQARRKAKVTVRRPRRTK